MSADSETIIPENRDGSKAAAHTPGPWAYTGNDDNDFVVWGPGEDQFLANVGNVRLGPVGAMVAFDLTSQANARLIAAAPDLLEALKEMVASGKIEGPKVADMAAYKARYEAALRAARSAIQRAEGGQ